MMWQIKWNFICALHYVYFSSGESANCANVTDRTSLIAKW